MEDDYFSSSEVIDRVRRLLVERPMEWEEVKFDGDGDGDGIYSSVMHVSGLMLRWSNYLGEMWLWENLGSYKLVDKIHHACLLDGVFEMMVSKINHSGDPPIKLIKLAYEIKSGDLEKAKFLADEVIRYFNPV